MLPIQEKKERESPIEVSFSHSLQTQGAKKNNPFVGLIFAFRDEYKRIYQTYCTGGGY